MLEKIKLTQGEMMLVLRRRSGDNQAQAAKKLRIPKRTYRDWELDYEEPRRKIKGDIGGLDSYEHCFLLRRRGGWTQEEIAGDMGVCRWWYNQMERGVVPSGELVEYWENQ